MPLQSNSRLLAKHQQGNNKEKKMGHIAVYGALDTNLIEVLKFKFLISNHG